MTETTLGDLISTGEGTVADIEAVLSSKTDAEEAGLLVLTEVLSRARLFEGPPTEVVVQFDLGVAGTRLGYQVTVGPGVSEVQPGWAVEPHATVRQDLAELLRAVYGPSGARYDATREVRISDEPAPPTLFPDDVWMARWNAATLAAGQLVRAASPHRADLTDLALRFGSDKWGGHWYTQHYERHFEPYRHQRIRILEIGVGGYNSPTSGGGSLRMWKHFFPRGQVFGLDAFDKSGVDEPRIRTVVGDQSSPEFLTSLAEEIGPLDIVVDDGSHLSDDVITSFTTLFPLLRPGGLYVIEDLQTSYWPGWNGNRSELSDPGTSVGFLKTLFDTLHHQDRVREAPYEPSEIERGVTGIHLYHNLVFIEKGVNAEQSAPSWLPKHTNPMTDLT
ncbi:hypothetical protein [Streptomyces sp. NBC_00280]|uniref:hypothetical protein n=1 Tax=Streptomyces sp. NBC_00280 TaxID=2975699 RepID=UPI00324E847F